MSEITRIVGWTLGRVSLSLALALCLLGLTANGSGALPPQPPHTLWGTLILGGAPAPDGTQIRVLANLTQVTSATVFSSGGSHGLYTIDVPVDDPDTPQKEGGANGERISFGVLNYEIAQTTLFDSGRVQNLNLANSSFTYNLSPVINGNTDIVFYANDGSKSLAINANGYDLGNTSVVIRANQECTTVAGETVQRCFNISPANNTGRSATITFYFYDSQIPAGQSCNNLNAYRRKTGGWELLTLDTTYGASGRDCTSDPHSLRVKNINDFSPFVLKAGSVPTAVTLSDFYTRSGNPVSKGDGVVVGLALLALAFGGLVLLWRWRKI